MSKKFATGKRMKQSWLNQHKDLTGQEKKENRMNAPANTKPVNEGYTQPSNKLQQTRKSM